MHTRLIILAATITACGGPTTVVEEPAPTPIAAPPSTLTIDAFAGSYQLTGEAAHDGCAEGVYLAARNIVIDAAAHSVYADVVDRRYDARVEDGALIAEGRFMSETACPESTLYERWVLTRDANGLGGTLTSTWLLPPDCVHPCTVEFAVVATP